MEEGGVLNQCQQLTTTENQLRESEKTVYPIMQGEKGHEDVYLYATDTYAGRNTGDVAHVGHRAEDAREVKETVKKSKKKLLLEAGKRALATLVGEGGREKERPVEQASFSSQYLQPHVFPVASAPLSDGALLLRARELVHALVHDSISMAAKELSSHEEPLVIQSQSSEKRRKQATAQTRYGAKLLTDGQRLQKLSCEQEMIEKQDFSVKPHEWRRNHGYEMEKVEHAAVLSAKAKNDQNQQNLMGLQARCQRDKSQQQ